MLRAAVQKERAAENMNDWAPFRAKVDLIDLLKGTGRTIVRPIAMKTVRNGVIRISKFITVNFSLCLILMQNYNGEKGKIYKS